MAQIELLYSIRTQASTQCSVTVAQARRAESEAGPEQAGLRRLPASLISFQPPHGPCGAVCDALSVNRQANILHTVQLAGTASPCRPTYVEAFGLLVNFQLQLRWRRRACLGTG